MISGVSNDKSINIISRDDFRTYVRMYVFTYVCMYVRGHAFGILKIVQSGSVFFKILTLIVGECIGPYLNK